jgi:hypothetical protein
MNIKFNSSLPAWITANKKMIERLKDPDRVLKTAALNSVALISERIQVFGKLSNGSDIGGGKGYSTKAIRAFNTSSGRRGFGNFGALATKKQMNARTRNQDDDTQFDYGYKEFRESLGRQTRYIDYTLSGDLMQSFIALKDGTRFYVTGFTDKDNADKKEWLENMHGIAFELSEKEIDLAFKDIQNDVNKIITGSK